MAVEEFARRSDTDRNRRRLLVRCGEAQERVGVEVEVGSIVRALAVMAQGRAAAAAAEPRA